MSLGEEVYAMANDLPEAAEHDPIIGDFKSFLARDPRLAGFTGFQKGDSPGQPTCSTFGFRN